MLNLDRHLQLHLMDSMESLYTYLAILFTFLLIIKHLFYKNSKLPPSPLALPIIGHLHLIKGSPQQAFQNLSSKFGPIVYLKLGRWPFLVVSSPSLVEECFTKNDIVFANRPRTISGDCLTYDYTAFIWTPYGHLWKVLRRLSVVELFSSKSLQKFSYTREEETRNIISHLKKITANGHGKIDLEYWFSLLSYNIIMKLVNGGRCIEDEVAGTEDGKMIFRQIKGKVAPSSPLNMSDFFPVLRWFDYKGVEKGMKLLHIKRDEFLQSLLEGFRKKKEGFYGNGDIKSSLVGTLFGLQESDPEFFTDELIKSMILVMFVGGTETSSSTMNKAVSILIKHSEVLLKVRAEIDIQVGNKRFLEESDLVNLPYLHCVIKETLRLNPPAPLLLPHCSTQDCIIGGFHVPRGTTLLANAWAIHRDPKVWEDPEEFKPERFGLIEEEKERLNFIPFGMGRRACPGSSMGIRVICLAIGMLIQCFDLETDELSEITCVPRETALEILSTLK